MLYQIAFGDNYEYVCTMMTVTKEANEGLRPGFSLVI